MKTEYNEKFNFNHIKAEEGMVITNYVDGQDILEYTSAKEMYCPKSLDLTPYHEISDEKDAEYKELQEMAIAQLP